MQRIEVKNFGPLTDITLDIKDYMIFIGPQASGKSTLAKLIYFFWEVKEEYKSTLPPTIALNKLLKTTDQGEHWSKALTSYVRDLFKKRFPSYRNGTIRFIYETDYSIDINVISITENFENDVLVSKGFFNELKDFESRINEFIPTKNLISKTGSQSSLENLIKIVSTNLLFDDSSVFFNKKLNSIDTFIPAGRMLVSILSNSIAFVENNNLDFYNEDFIRLTNKIRNYIATPNYENLFGWSARTNSDDSQSDIFSLANELAFKILKGDFHSSNSTDGIMHYHNGSGYIIPLKNTSSGQQEASWLINTIHYLLAESMGGEGNHYNTIIEEPETHLFPEAQRDMTYLISLLANQPASKVILTTHSPYVLAALNNLVKAYIVGQSENNKKSVSELIDLLLWIDPKRLFVGYLDKGKIKDIVDQETHLISYDDLDGVSVDIMTKFDHLLEIQYDG